MDTSETYVKMCNCDDVQDNVDKVVNVEKSYFVFMEGQDEFLSWLPTQDEIQRIMFGEFDNPIYIAEQFVDFHRKWLWLDLTSMEQLWLVFYMYEKHKKIWYRKKWLKKTCKTS